MTTLTIGDGVTTCNLIWDSSVNRRYMLARDDWAPAIASRRTSELGGRGAYNDVAEEIGLNILGDSQVEVLANLATLARLLDQADRWSEGEGVAPVLVAYTPTGGTKLNQALILGRAGGDETSGVSLPVTLNSGMGGYIIADVKLRFRRRGLWITGSDSASSSSGANPSVLSATLPNTTIASPLRLDLNFPTMGADPINTVLIVSNNANQITIAEAETLADTVRWTSVADAGNKARGGSVLRYTPLDTLNKPSFNLDLTTFTAANHVFEVYAVVRNNSATISFLLQVAFSNIPDDELTTPQILIDTTNFVTPRIICLGTMPNRTPGGSGRATRMRLFAQASAAAGSLDIDYVVLVGTNNEMTKAIPLGHADASDFSVPMVFQIDPLPLFAELPWVNIYKSGDPRTFALPYAADPYLMHTGTTVYVLWLATGGGVATSWVYTNGAAAIVANTITVTRYSADLIAR